MPGVSNHGVLLLLQPCGTGPQRRAARLSGHDGRDRATIEGYTAHVVGGGTRFMVAYPCASPRLDLKLKTFNEGRGHQGRSQRRCTAGSTGLARSAIRIWNHTTARRKSWLALAARRRTRESNSARSATRSRKDPNPISSYVEVGMDALNTEALPDPLGRHYRRSCAQRTQGVQPQNGVRQPLRRPVGIEIQHLGLPVVAHLQGSPTLNCGPIPLRRILATTGTNLQGVASR